MNGIRQYQMGKTNGSALIVVLWVLVLIGFLAGEYLEHNRGKAYLAFNAWDSVRQKQAVESVLDLFATDSRPIPAGGGKKRNWEHFSPCGIDLWASVNDESRRININTASDTQIRDRIIKLLGESHLDEADGLADAILDWRDSDDLVRLNGAEAGFYKSLGLAYRPANGPFKVLTELILVRGVTPEVFWGDPFTALLTEEEGEIEPGPTSLLDNFTIYPAAVKRVNIIVPGRRKGYSLIIAFLEKKDGQWSVLQVYRNMLATSAGETQSFDQTGSGFEFL